MAEPLHVTLNAARKIDGWFSWREAKLYLRYLAGPWCEVGSWRGRSARVLASTGYPGVCVEWGKGSPQHDREWGLADDILGDLHRNLRGFHVRIIEGDLREVHPKVGSVQFLHLDADHTPEMTQAAFDLYAPKVIPGGYLALHDAWGERGSHKHCGWPGTMAFAKDLIASPHWEHIEDAQRAAIFKKREDMR